MINIDDFVKRLEKILDYYSLSASAFADAVGIQRSGVSHLMSGRNKPSLDLVMKICESFPEVDLYWLLNGKGKFPKNDEAGIPHHLPPAVHKEEDLSVKQNYNAKAADLFSLSGDEKTINDVKENHVEIPFNFNGSDIDRIVVFYKSGIFKSYTSEN